MIAKTARAISSEHDRKHPLTRISQILAQLILTAWAKDQTVKDCDYSVEKQVLSTNENSQLFELRIATPANISLDWTKLIAVIHYAGIPKYRYLPFEEKSGLGYLKMEILDETYLSIASPYKV